MQRLRIKFHRGEEIKYISHLDIMRLWERSLRRALIPLALTEGFNPHSRLSVAAPLAVGITSDAELMDIFLSRQVTPHWFTASVEQQLPSGIKIFGVVQVADTLPSLQSQVQFAEFSVKIQAESADQISTAISKLMALEQLPWQHRRDTGNRSYDLRALIDDLWLADWQQPYGIIGMRLRCDSDGSGRPEQVTLAMGFKNYPESIHRTGLVLKTSK